MDFRDNGHKPEETTLIQAIPFGKNTELRVEVMTWLGPEPNRTAISARLFVPGKHTGEEGKMYPTKSGIFVRPENVPRLILALQEAQEVINPKMAVQRQLELRRTYRTRRDPFEAVCGGCAAA